MPYEKERMTLPRHLELETQACFKDTWQEHNVKTRQADKVIRRNNIEETSLHRHQFQHICCMWLVYVIFVRQHVFNMWCIFPSSLQNSKQCTVSEGTIPALPYTVCAHLHICTSICSAWNNIKFDFCFHVVPMQTKGYQSVQLEQRQRIIWKKCRVPVYQAVTLSTH